jgi:hypothetical protein
VALCGCAAAHDARVADLQDFPVRTDLGQWLNLRLNTEFLRARVEEPRPNDDTVRACIDIQNAQIVAYFLDWSELSLAHTGRVARSEGLI